MDVGADNFHFALEDQNGRKLPVQAVRPPATTELHIDSLDRYQPSMLATTPYFLNFPNNQTIAKLAGPILLNNNQSGTGYAGTTVISWASTPLTIQTSRPLTYGYYSRVALTQFFLRFQVPTLMSGINTNLTFYYGTTAGAITNTYNAVLGRGYFTYADLAAGIQAAVRAVSPLAAFTCTAPVNPGDGFTFATNDPNQFMAFSLQTPTLNELVTVTLLRCGRTLGLNRACYGYQPETNITGQPTAAPTLWVTATGGPPNLLITDYVDIVSSSLTNYKDAKDTNSTLAAPNAVLGRIWLTEQTVDVAGTSGFDATEVGSAPISVVKQWTNPNWCKWSPNQTIDKIDITLLDMFGYPVFWDPNFQTEWSGTLTLTE